MELILFLLFVCLLFGLWLKLYEWVKNTKWVKIGGEAPSIVYSKRNHLRRDSMKRELILDDVKYDGEHYSTKILKQTHRGDDFTPSGRAYRNNSINLESWDYPEIYELNVYVCGNHIGKDNYELKTKDKAIIDKLLAAVKAYNEELSCDENLETAKKNFMEDEVVTLSNIRSMLAKMKDCGRDEFMELKKRIYLERVSINLGWDKCIYCIDNNLPIPAFNCDNCDYAKENGHCNNVGSVYKKIETARNKLIDALGNYWETV